MRGYIHNYAASDGVDVAILSLAILIAGIVTGAVAYWKYIKGETDNPLIPVALVTDSCRIPVGLVV